MRIQELTKKREEHIKSCIENNDNSHQIIADMYSDPSHFIYELLQNAEDARAKRVNFKLFTDKLIFWHNGEDFNYDDIDALTSIGNSTKNEEINKIGKFGAGFKSVFSITKSPKIYSGKYKFEIVDFIIPKEIDENYNETGTKFVFPFNNSKKSQKEIYELIAEKLKILENEILLFLKNIQEIHWKTIEEKGAYLKEHQKKIKYDITNVFYEKVFVTSQINNENLDAEFLLFSSAFILKKKNLVVNIAYKTENNKIVEADSPYLSVFFPTKIETDLNFLIHAPYKTTPSRETIPFEDEDNKELTIKLASLFTKSLLVLRDKKIIDIPFLNKLPLKTFFYDKPIYSIFQKELVSLLKEEKILPSSIDTYIQSTDAILARGKDLVNLLDSKDLETLFKKKYWLSTEITRDNTNELRTFIIENLDIDEKDFETFAKAIDTEFLKSKTDKWLVDFYSLLINQNSLFNKYGTLRYKRIFKLDNNEFASIYDENGRINIYLPRKDKSNFKVIKKIFIQNEQSKIFFEKYNVNYPDRLAELKEFIAPKYSINHTISLNEFKVDWNNIIRTYNKADRTKQDIIDLFKDKYIIYTNNSEFQKPNNVYIPNDLLKNWFDNQITNFISDELYKSNLDLFLEKLGCKSLPKRIEIEPQLTDDDKDKLTNGNRPIYNLGEIKTVDYTLDGIDFLLKNITIEKSILIWKVLENHFISFNNWNKKKIFKGVFEWFYRYKREAYFTAFFTKLLQQNKWLYNKNNELIKPSDLSISEFSEVYECNNEFLKEIDEILGFKIDEIKKLEEKGYTVISKEEKDEFEKWKKQREIKEDDSLEWKPKYNPEEVEIELETFETKLVNEDLSHQPIRIVEDEIEDNEPNNEEDNEKSTKFDDKKAKEIGNWGEKAVYSFLLKKFSDYDIVWLNQKGNVGKGYDFVIKQDYIEKYYIEVKTKTEAKPELIKITGTQWEWARTLYNQDKGDKYLIYVVLNAGKSEKIKIKEIKNPIKKWKKGELKAHPVNFEL